MTALWICTDTTNNLSGMWSVVSRFDTSMNLIIRIAMNRIGTVNGTGITCNQLPIDVANNETLQ